MGVFNHIAVATFYKQYPCGHVLKKYHSLEDFSLSYNDKIIVTQKCLFLRDYAAYLSFTGNVACIVQRDEISSYFRCNVTKL